MSIPLFQLILLASKLVGTYYLKKLELSVLAELRMTWYNQCA